MAYASGGHARYKEATTKVREDASEMLSVEWKGDNCYVHELCKLCGLYASIVQTMNCANYVVVHGQLLGI